MVYRIRPLKPEAELPLLTISLTDWVLMEVGGSQEELNNILSDKDRLKSFQNRYTYARRLKEQYSQMPSYRKAIQRDGDEFFLRLAATYRGD
ncbi:hypothetical protein [Methylomarinum vadi]|uniref:hypothetical protein n=1 Tax=Methylomarinum vadi TaxID=438855 RepID=UPI0004DEF530|nr:hypothetical protein [Methylomarinum vadi]